QEGAFASLLYVNEAKCRAVMFNYLTQNRYGSGSLSPVKLSGLQPDKKYSVREINLYPDVKSTLPANAVYSGNYLMTVGFNPRLNTTRTSVILELTEAK
ncbi:MAG TPA: GH36 C-terminal domain-containing protein, partial [Chitinophagaceae bacterium]|nr:GH36 C-terminal domain-containing protein [Chitinophagaceae bacterium]